ncbi:dystrophin-like [Macrosteles quadrilineatus]|uniref:dystrophin-like n=1 Tax=Macrosteles quadrilineatus TaxID=74068 RepID=UPI0023E0CD13|nr:dystrophin-like [Macrosteles quadrilineatus]
MDGAATSHKPQQWQKAETDSGAVYYVDHSAKKTAWDHPKFRVAMEMIEECNNIKYAAYRTAAKLNILQKTLSLDHVQLTTIAGVFHRHHIQVTENCLTLEYSELEAILNDIFFAASKESPRHHFQVDVSTELTLHFLLSVFDRQERHRVQVLSAKIALVCLCAAKLQDKYQYLFSQLADHNNCLPRRKLRNMLDTMVSITDYLSESLAFSADLIPATVDSCFQQSHGPLGISEDVFMNWLMREPQLLVWLSTLYRLKAAEKVSHGVRCGVCRTYPIVGLRYRCLRCLGYDQCQSCFFHGRLSKRHKLKHPMQEYCWETSTGQATVAFFKAMVNRLCGNTSRLQYLPVQPVSGSNECLAGDSSEESTLVSCTDSSSLSSSVSPRLNPQQELNSIISQLERQSKELFDSTLGDDVSARLHQHKLFLETQIHRLKQLQRHVGIANNMNSLERMQSTPLVATSVRHEFTGLSPIYTEPWIAQGPNYISWAGGDQLTAPLAVDSPITPQQTSRFSQWLEGTFRPSKATTQKATDEDPPINDLHSDLDNILDKLQEMLASNFSLTENKNKMNAQNGTHHNQPSEGLNASCT